MYFTQQAVLNFFLPIYFITQFLFLLKDKFKIIILECVRTSCTCTKQTFWFTL